MRPLPLLAALVPLLGLGELALHGYFAARAPGFEDYAALAPELLKLKQPGMPVVVAPRWAEPLLRQAAPGAFPLGELARPSDDGFAAFLEVSLLGAEAPELARYRRRDESALGPFRLAIRDNPSFQPLRFDFVNAVETEAVEVYAEADDGSGRARCPVVERARAGTGGLHGPVARPARRFECAGGRVVAASLIDDEQYRPRRCILVDPPRSGRIVLRFGAVPGSRRLLGYAGFSYFLGRDFEGPRAELTLREAGRELGRHRADPSRGWARFDAPRGGEEGAIEVSVARSDPEPGDFCFALEAR